MTSHEPQPRVAVLLSLFLFITLGLICTLTAAANTILTDDFASESPLLAGWQLYGNSLWGTDVSVSSEQALSGTQSLKLVDLQPDRAVGLRSALLPITAKEAYRATVSVFLVDGGGSLYLEFWDEQHKRIGYRIAMSPSTRHRWTQLMAEDIAPADAVYTSVLLYSPGGTVGTVFFDDVTLLHQPRRAVTAAAPYQVNLAQLGAGQVLSVGSPIQASQMGASAQGWDLFGAPTWYFTAPSPDEDRLYAVRITDGEVLGEYRYSAGGAQSWALLPLKNGNVYISGGSTVFKFDHLKQQVTRVASPNGMIWDLEQDPAGLIYGATYPNCRIFTLDPTTDTVTDLGSVCNQDYARAIAATDQYAFVGVGPQTDLIAYHLETGESRSILPERYRGKSAFVRYVEVRGDRLFAAAGDGTNVMLVYDVNTLELIRELIAVGRPVSPVDEGRYVYYRQGSVPYRYDLETDTIKSNGIIQPAANNLGFAVLDESLVPEARRSLFQGTSLVGIQLGNYWALNHKTHQILQVPIDVRSASIRINSLGALGNKVFGGGISPGGLFVYDTKTSETTVVPPAGQADSVVMYNDMIYYGTYTGANVRVYNTITGENRTIGAVGYEQDRPVAMIEHDGRIYIGTVPDYGLSGGALAIVNTESERIDTYRHVVPNHSVVALASGEGVVYGGTAIAGGLGYEPGAGSGAIFAWDPATDKVLWTINPLPGEPAIGALVMGADGLLWGAGTNSIFALDPRTQEVVWEEVVVQGAQAYRWREAFTTAYEEYVLITLARRYFAIIDTKTQSMTLIPSDFDRVAVDAEGNVYVNDIAALHKIPYAEWTAVAKASQAAVQPASVDGPADQDAKQVVQPVPVPIVETARNLIDNYDFAAGTDAAGAPVGWTFYQQNADADANATLSSERARLGQYALKLTDQSDTAVTGLRSQPYPAQPGLVYRTSVDAYIESGRHFMLYLEFRDESKRLEAHTATISAATDWQTAAVAAEAPAGTTNMTVLLYSGGTNVGVGYFDNVSLVQVQ